MLLTTLVCSKFPLPQQSIPLSVNRTPPPLAHDIIKFNDVHIKPRDYPFEGTDQDHSSPPFGEVRSSSLEIKFNKTTSSTSDSADVFYPASSEEQSSAKEGRSGENVDQISKGRLSDSVPSDRYYTPDEEGQFFSDFTVSLCCFIQMFLLQDLGLEETQTNRGRNDFFFDDMELDEFSSFRKFRVL